MPREHPKHFSVMRRALPFLVTAVAATLLVAIAAASPRLSVSLVYFRGEGQDNAARLEWRTATEEDTAGFKLERGASAAGPFTYLSDIGIIAARGSVSSGATYEATDDTVSNGQTYWYRLVEVELDNNETTLDTVELSISGPTPTAEAVGGSGDSGSSPTPPPTSTSAPTDTPEPTRADTGDDDAAATATRTNGATATPAATNTRQTAAATATSNRSGPTNTPPPSPTRMVFNQNDDVAEAAGPSSVAQVTPTQGASGYPGPAAQETEDTPSVDATPTVDSYPGPTTANGENGEPEAVEDGGYPGVVGGNSNNGAAVGERAVGAGDDPALAGDEAQEESDSGLSRVLLWVGFIFALLIFAGGVIFAIVLSTRKRYDNLGQ